MIKTKNIKDKINELFFNACIEGNILTIKEIAKKYPDLVNLIDKRNNKTPLLHALSIKDFRTRINTISTLVNFGATIDTDNVQTYECLQYTYFNIQTVNEKIAKNLSILEHIALADDLHVITKITLIRNLFKNILLQNENIDRAKYNLLCKYPDSEKRLYDLLQPSLIKGGDKMKILEARKRNEKIAYGILEKACLSANKNDVIKAIGLFHLEIVQKKKIKGIMNLLFNLITSETDLTEKLNAYGDIVIILIKLGFSKHITKHKNNANSFDFLENLFNHAMSQVITKPILCLYLIDLYKKIIIEYIKEVYKLDSIIFKEFIKITTVIDHLKSHILNYTSTDDLKVFDKLFENAKNTLKLFEEPLKETNKHLADKLNKYISQFITNSNDMQNRSFLQKTSILHNNLFTLFKMNALCNHLADIKYFNATMQLRYISLLIELYKMNSLKKIDNIVLLGPGATDFNFIDSSDKYFFAEQLAELAFLLPNTNFFVIEPDKDIFDAIKNKKYIPQNYIKILGATLAAQDFNFKNVQEKKIFMKVMCEITKNYEMYKSTKQEPIVRAFNTNFLRFMHSYSQLIVLLKSSNTVFISTKALMYSLNSKEITIETILNLHKLLPFGGKAFIDNETFRILQDFDENTLNYYFEKQTHLPHPLHLASKQNMIDSMNDSEQEALMANSLKSNLIENPQKDNYYNLYSLHMGHYFGITQGHTFSKENIRKERQNLCINCDDVVCLEATETKRQLK